MQENPKATTVPGSVKFIITCQSGQSEECFNSSFAGTEMCHQTQSHFRLTQQNLTEPLLLYLPFKPHVCVYVLAFCLYDERKQ